MPARVRTSALRFRLPQADFDQVLQRRQSGHLVGPIDLDQDDPEAKISRRHARLTQISGQFLIEDLGSTNGTYINRGPRLLPGIKQPLNPGDEIIVGKTFLKFFVS